jgi:hypothetical protein
VLLRHALVRASAISWRGAGGYTNQVGDVAWDEFPDIVGDHKTERTYDVVLGT